MGRGFTDSICAWYPDCCRLNTSLYPLLELESSYLSKAVIQQPQEQRYPFLPTHAVFSCVHTKVRLLMLGVFNVRTDVNACGCTRGAVRESALNGDSEKKMPLPHRGIEPVSAATCRSDAIAVELHFLPKPVSKMGECVLQLFSFFLSFFF